MHSDGINQIKKNTTMTAYEILDNGGPGCPGETARVMTRNYIEFKSPFKSSNSVIRKILNDRDVVYKQIGMDVLNSVLIEKIIQKANGEILFAAFVEMAITNKTTNNFNAVMENFDILVEVMLDNYNRLVPANKGIYDFTSFKNRLMLFMKSELI
jgi:hypothetical protein